MQIFSQDILGCLTQIPTRQPVEASPIPQAVMQPPHQKKSFGEWLKGIVQWIWDNGGKILTTIGTILAVIKGIFYLKEKFAPAN